jgi:DTW domain-containing protein YfiP
MDQNRKRKTKNPCSGCGLHVDRCLCELIPEFNLPSRLCLVIYKRELKRTTNTGQLAIKALTNSIMRVRGDQDSPLDLTNDLCDDYQSLLLYPSDDASELTTEYLQKLPSRPIQLIVPDGNWRQASKVHTRQKELKDIPRVKLRNQDIDTHFMRTETMPEGMATLQAIANAFKILEGQEVGEALHKLYQEKLTRTLQGRGTIA